MNLKLTLATLLFWTLSLSVVLPNSVDTLEVESKSKFEMPRFSNVKVRAMMRTEFRAESLAEGEPIETNFRLKPAMLQLTGDFGKHLSFAIRNRFDWPTDIQSDGTPMSLIVANIQIKPNDKLKFILGKQMMMMGGWEFDYNPMEVFFYSMVGDNLQGFQTGASVHYNVGKQALALQLTKVTDRGYQVGDFKNAWNTTMFWGGDLFDGIYKPLWSYTFTNAGEGKYLHSIMLGNQFNIGRVRLELDACQHNAMRYYTLSDANKGQYQAKTTERSLVAFAEYTFPGDRFLFGVKGAYDKRFKTDGGDMVNKQLTTSAQLRYRLFPRYGVSVHAAYAHKFDRSNETYATDWAGNEQDMFYTGLIWDFTTK